MLFLSIIPALSSLCTAMLVFTLSPMLLALRAAASPVTASFPIRIGVMLGERATNRSGVRFATSDQEEWAYLRALDDIQNELMGAGTPASLEIVPFYSGASEVEEEVVQFLREEAQRGTTYIVGPRETSSLLGMKMAALEFGLVLVSPSSGLAELDPPREHIFRLWPNDSHEAVVLDLLISEELSLDSAVVLAPDDVLGRALVTAFVGSFRGDLLLDPVFFDPGVASDFGLPSIRAALVDNALDEAAFLVLADADEIAAILDEMERLDWPTSRTRFVLSDRATPTRVVADDDHRAFAAALRTVGVLSALPRSGTNPSYDSLSDRWSSGGAETPLFASAVATYDGIRMSVRACLLRPTSTSAAQSAFRSTAAQHYGASGAMALDLKGDLMRAVYDVYEVDATEGWRVIAQLQD